MKLFYDFFPIILFFIAYKLFGIYVATSVAIGVSIAQTLATRLVKKKFDMMQLVTMAILIVLGGATLILHNKLFIQWKPTVINWILALVFLGSEYIGKHNILRRIMKHNIKLPDNVWRHLNFSWIGFFTAIGALNIYVVYHFSEDAWVNFKLFGVLGLTVIFAIAQAVYLSRHIKTPD